MANEDVVSPDPMSATRRAVLRTGARLAYAAPVVAASMKLAAQAGSAQVSGPTCTPDGGPCSFGDPGACCSQACGSGAFFPCGGLPTCCIDIGLIGASADGTVDGVIHYTIAE